MNSVKALIICAAIALASALVSLGSITRHFEGGITYEFCHYAEIGRNLIEGRGYRTAMVYPSTLAYLDENGIPFNDRSMAPVLERFPLQAALAAAAEALWGKEDTALLMLSLLLLAAGTALTYGVGRLFFSPHEAAFAALFMAFQPSVQRGFILWGLPDFGFLIFVLAAAAVLSLKEPLRPGQAFLAGILAGLAWLARANLILWIPLFFWTLWRAGGSRLRNALCFGTAMALISAPGWIYNLRWFGSITPPILAQNLAHQTILATEPWLHYRVFSVSQVLNGHLSALQAKAVNHMVLYLRDFPSLWQMHLVFPFTVLGAWKLFRRKELEPGNRGATIFAGLMLAMLAVQILAFSFLRYETLGPRVKGRYLLWFAPAAFLLAARGASTLGRYYRLGRYENLVLWAFGALNLAFFTLWLLSPQGPRAHPAGLHVREWPELQAAASLPKGLIATNLPGQVAWYARRSAVALPAEPQDLLAIARRHEISAILVSRLSIGELENTPGWKRLLADPQALKVFCKTGNFRIERDFGTALILVKKSPSHML